MDACHLASFFFPFFKTLCHTTQISVFWGVFEILLFISVFLLLGGNTEVFYSRCLCVVTEMIDALQAFQTTTCILRLPSAWCCLYLLVFLCPAWRFCSQSHLLLRLHSTFISLLLFFFPVCHNIIRLFLLELSLVIILAHKLIHKLRKSEL